MFNEIPFRAARNLMNTSMDDMLSDRFFRNFFDVSDMVGTAGSPLKKSLPRSAAFCFSVGPQAAGPAQ